MSTVQHPVDTPSLTRRSSFRRMQRDKRVEVDTAKQVLVVDERAAIRAGVRALLSGERGLRVNATGSWSAATKHAASGTAELCMVNYGLARGSTGLFLAYRFKQLPQPPRVVLYSEYVDGCLAGAAKVAGADGLICQHATGEELAQVLRLVASGERQFPTIPPSAMYELCKHLHPADRPILTMAAHDTLPAHISEVMGIADDWLRTRTWAILEQLHNRLANATPVPAASLAIDA